MRVAGDRLRHEMAASEEIICGWDVISRLIPEVRKTQQRQMEQKNRGEDQRKYVNSPELWEKSIGRRSLLTFQTGSAWAFCKC